MIRYSVKKLTSPTFDAVSVERMRQQCNVSHREDDNFLRNAAATAVKFVEKNLESVLCESTYRITLDRFPAANSPLPIPLWPIKQVDAIRFTDTNGDEQTLDLTTIVQPASDGRFSLLRKDFEPWPSVKYNPNSVEIDVTAGWASANEIPEPITQAILMLASHWYQFRESVLIGQTSKEIEFSTNALLEIVRPGEDSTSDQIGEDYAGW